MILFTDKTRNLQHLILQKSRHIQCDEICILSGYIGLGPIELISQIPNIKVNIIYGLASEGVAEKLLDQLNIIHSNDKNEVSVFCPEIQSHAKLYLWKYKGEVMYGLNGSANFSSNGLLSEFRELLSEVNKEDFKEFNSYYEKIFESAFPINERAKIKNKSPKQVIVKNDKFGICETSSLYSEKSKINWGHGGAHNNKRDAYIPINKPDILAHPELFPPKSNNNGLGKADNDPIDVIWDDGTNMVCLMEGSTVINGLRYPNKISTYKDKKILGDYLRSRMKLKPGEFVSEKNFKNYSRDTITISKLSEGVYYFDFKPTWML